ncbi:MAG: DUF1549 domain-containing protein [Pirellula sp.]
MKTNYLPKSLTVLFFSVITVGGHCQLSFGLEVDFAHEIAPLIKKHCIACHSSEVKKGGLSINTRADLLQGGESGTAIELGKSAKSPLIERVESIETDFKMPPEGAALTKEQIALLKKWIDAGAAWDQGFAFKMSSYEPPLKPRRPELPPAKQHRENPIDRILDAYLDKHSLPTPKSVSDEVFVRRVYLDLVGLLPEPERLAQFLVDTRPNKRQLLIQELLNSEVAYAEHWLNFWNDLLRNDYGGTGFITNGRTQISRWLYTALIQNKPYDLFVRELIAPTPESAGFSNGIRWRGTVSAGQTVEIQFAQSVGQSFLGINLKCASCHDSFVDRWKLDDAYGLAAIYSTTPLEVHRCDKPIGQQASPRWLFPELGQVDAKATQPERLKQLAALMTHPENGRFSRAIVNRLWHRLMGYGIVHPVDAMQSQPWSEDLLDYLAVDLVDHAYDLKQVLASICNSAAYQSATQVIEPNAADGPFVYQGPRSRRLTAEQFVDSVWQLTGTAPMRFDAPVFRGKPSLESGNPTPLGGKWIWSYADASSNVPKANETISLRTSITLENIPLRAGVAVTCDNSFTLYVNGASVQSSDNWENVVGMNVEGRLKKGKNEILIVAKNAGDAPNPAGCYFECRLVYEDGRVETIASNDHWEWTSDVPNKNGKFKKEPDDWKPAAILGNQSIWGRVSGQIQGVLALASSKDQPMVRSSLLKSDLLQRTLGRPNRDQIVSMRPNDLSTLEAIDLNNSKTLFDLLDQGAQRTIQRVGNSRDKVVRQIMLHALSREPTPTELSISKEMLNETLSPSEIQDYLWAVLMMPEFQLVR